MNDPLASLTTLPTLVSAPRLVIRNEQKSRSRDKALPSPGGSMRSHSLVSSSANLLVIIPDT